MTGRERNIVGNGYEYGKVQRQLLRVPVPMAETVRSGINSRRTPESAG